MVVWPNTCNIIFYDLRIAKSAHTQKYASMYLCIETPAIQIENTLS